MYKKELSNDEISFICISIGKIQALATSIKKSAYPDLQVKWEKELIEETEKIFHIVVKD